MNIVKKTGEFLLRFPKIRSWFCLIFGARILKANNGGRMKRGIWNNSSSGLMFVLLIATFAAYAVARGEDTAKLLSDNPGITSVSRTMTYQGILTDADGNPISEQSRTITFRLFDSLTGGTELWNQVTPITTDANGYFSANLNNLNLPFDEDYFLELQIQGEQPMMPRQIMGMAGTAAFADTSEYSRGGSGGNGGGWVDDGSVITLENEDDSLAIGVPNTNSKVNIEVNHNGWARVLRLSNSSSGNSAVTGFYLKANNNSSLQLGKLGSETSEWGGYGNPGDAFIYCSNQSNHLNIIAANPSNGDINFYSGRYALHPPVMVLTHTGNVGIGTSYPSVRLDVNGTTKTHIIEITGGADIAEPFPMTHSDELKPGSVVIIDEENPGQLTLSNCPYDRRVAGIVSGAGGVNPGLTLSQQDIIDGDQNIALSGRVYALATASNGAIKPGDLLTTSDIPAHAMRVSDYDRANGTVIGKVMSSLEDGEGLVLVLVSLQ
jgi:hypothetical protein